VPTSLEQTILMTGDIDRLVGVVPAPVVVGADDGIRVIGLGLAGRRDEARQRLQAMIQPMRIPAFQSWVTYLTAWLDRRAAGMRLSADLSTLKIQDDPEAIFQEGWLLCDVGEYREGLGLLRRAEDTGYYVAATLSSAPQFAALQENPEFVAILASAEAGRERALAAFRAAGGERLLGS